MPTAETAPRAAGVQRPLHDRLCMPDDLRTRLQQLLRSRGSSTVMSVPEVLRQRSRRLLRGTE